MVKISNLPNLDSLRPYFGNPPINTGIRRALTTISGVVIDDIERLYAITDEHGYVVLHSGIGFPPYLYRGQPEEYELCVPTLGRLQSSEDKLLALCRNAAFEDVLSEHPFIRASRKIRYLNHPLRIDSQGLAQHYGQATDLLDFTSNFDVASFFAVCYLDIETGEYRPIVNSEKIGIIYRIQPALFGAIDIDTQLEAIGWQPLKRPEQQRAFGLKMKKGFSINMLPYFEIIKFRHCEKVSNRIWKSFDEGRVLFPDDSAAELAKQVKTLYQFTRNQLDRAWERLDKWNESATTSDYRLATENKCGILLSEASILSWDGFSMERDEETLERQLRELLNKVHYSRAGYPA